MVSHLSSQLVWDRVRLSLSIHGVIVLNGHIHTYIRCIINNQTAFQFKGKPKGSDIFKVLSVVCKSHCHDSLCGLRKTKSLLIAKSCSFPAVISQVFTGKQVSLAGNSDSEFHNIIHDDV